MMYVLVDIGCIECGVRSNIVGVFESAEAAEKASLILDEKMSWRGGGQNEFQVFALPPVGEISEEYRSALSA